MSTNNPFQEVSAPRVVGRCKHKRSDILVIALATYLCGGTDYTDMQSLCRERGKELAPLVELPNGCPSVDTFERVLQRIEPASLMACLDTYGKTIVKSLQGLQVSIDGKTLRGAKRKTGTTHILSAWVDDYQLCIAQQVVEEKENEIVVIPQILESLDLEGAVVSIDALGTQTTIAEQIVQSKADYVLSLKRNHKHLYEDLKTHSQDATHATLTRPSTRGMDALRHAPILLLHARRCSAKVSMLSGLDCKRSCRSIGIVNSSRGISRRAQNISTTSQVCQLTLSSK